ncbi:hypothetical protein GUJ93_ZPchr0005g16307 [Zizania palustris]|uniref:Uncharacterized protein n=1 Tax=Zizania palustris TaxID=103762 RepID=A0A8J5VZW6_ZIZPA|nr:hypothetical protein GUJ93_ZPchr0005g16307 [Zizania palustris]
MESAAALTTTTRSAHGCFFAPARAWRRPPEGGSFRCGNKAAGAPPAGTAAGAERDTQPQAGPRAEAGSRHINGSGSFPVAAAPAPPATTAIHNLSGSHSCSSSLDEEAVADSAQEEGAAQVAETAPTSGCINKLFHGLAVRS